MEVAPAERWLQGGLHKFANNLLGFESNKMATAIGPLYTFNANHPSGHYQLRTADYCDALLLRKLQSISAHRKEAVLASGSDDDFSQNGDLEGFR